MFASCGRLAAAAPPFETRGPFPLTNAHSVARNCRKSRTGRHYRRTTPVSTDRSVRFVSLVDSVCGTAPPMRALTAVQTSLAVLASPPLTLASPALATFSAPPLTVAAGSFRADGVVRARDKASKGAEG